MKIRNITIQHNKDNNTIRLHKRNNNKEINFNVNFNEYYIYKATRNFRELKNIEELFNEDELRYCNILLFKKIHYNKEDIDKWIEFCNELPLKFISKSFPPLEIIKKITIYN